jgi:ring-1,2-phenylacetyl-CoA epoxidase subunit PaaA
MSAAQPAGLAGGLAEFMLAITVERLYYVERKSSVNRQEGATVVATPVEELAQWTEDQVRAHLDAGKLVEGLQHMSPEYLKGIRRILTVSADTEFVSAPAYLRAARHAPALNNFGSAMSIVQDELAHAHIGFRLLGDLGVDMDWLVYERPANAFKYPYAFDVPLNSWVELVCANALYDQAGFTLLGDVHESSTFGPWKRALAKVDKEETFHLRHGRTWLKKLVKDREGKAEVQQAVDWMFILTLEWFGLPDDLKKHSEQLDYGFKGKTNDQLRQTWMAAVVPFMEEIDIRVPAHWDAEEQRYVIDCPFPATFDAEKREWMLDDGAIAWEDVMVRWRGRGPMNEDYVHTLQRGYQTTHLGRAR